MPTAEQDVISFEATFDVNVRDPVLPDRRARSEDGCPRWRKHRRHHHDGGPRSAWWARRRIAASKAAIVGWAAAFAAANVRVNAVSSGPTTTEGTIEVLGPGALAETAATVPLNRPASVEEIARVVAFVASPRAG